MQTREEPLVEMHRHGHGHLALHDAPRLGILCVPQEEVGQLRQAVAPAELEEHFQINGLAAGEKQIQSRFPSIEGSLGVVEDGIQSNLDMTRSVCDNVICGLNLFLFISLFEDVDIGVVLMTVIH